MMDLDEVYNSTIKKTQSLLESKGIALSLREIKKLDTINLSGFRNDGERLLTSRKIWGEQIRTVFGISDFISVYR